MGLFNTSLGIDFKSDHLILTLLQRSFRKIRMVDYQICPLGTEGPKEAQEAQWINLITTFISRNEVDRERISISIPREKALVRFMRLPAAVKENLRKVVEYEAPKYIPFDREEFFFDFQILKEDGEWVELIVAFVKREDLDLYLNLLKKMGIQPISVQVPAVAAINLFLYHGGDEGNEVSVLLDFNEPFCEMNILKGREWKENFHLPLGHEKKEERILHAFRQSNPMEGSLARTMFFVYGVDATRIALSTFPEIKGMKGVSPPPMDRIKGREEEIPPSNIYSSVGLPLQGLTKTQFHLNLLPIELRKKVREYGKPTFFILLSLTILLALAWGGGVYSRYRNELESLREEMKKKKPAVEAVEKLQRQRVEFAAEMEEFGKITRGAASMVQILREMAQILPSSVWIWQYKFAGKEIEISGFADSASELISLLDKSPLFEKVEFLAPVTKEREKRVGVDRERERFKIKMRLEGAGGAS
jgi:general secretion pathway protein L